MIVYVTPVHKTCIRVGFMTVSLQLMIGNIWLKRIVDRKFHDGQSGWQAGGGME